MAVKLIATYLLLELELILNETCKTSRLTISSSFTEVESNKGTFPHESFPDDKFCFWRVFTGYAGISAKIQESISPLLSILQNTGINIQLKDPHKTSDLLLSMFFSDWRRDACKSRNFSITFLETVSKTEQCKFFSVLLFTNSGTVLEYF